LIISSTKFKIVLAIVVVTTPAVLLILGPNFFDNGPTICLSKLIIEKDCPGCGITRAVQHSIHGEWKTAYEYNKLVLIVGPILFILWLKELLNLIKFFREKG